MSQALFTSMTGLNAGTEQLTVVSDNIANMNTTAYKTSRVDFQDIWYQTKTTGTNSTKVSGGTNPYQVGIGVRCASITKNFDASSTNTTGRSLDLAITGNGWFSVQNADGQTLLTRDGTFSLDEMGYLCTSDGCKVLGMNSTTSSVGSTTPIRVPTAIKVIEGGTPDATFKNLKISELNNAEPITPGTFTIYVTTTTQQGTGVFREDGTEIMEAVDTTQKVDIDLTDINEDTTVETLVGKITGPGFTSKIEDGTIKFTVNPNVSLKFETPPSGGSNFVIQSNLAGVGRVNEYGDPADPTRVTACTYTSTPLNYSATITSVDDITSDQTLLYKSVSFGKDGRMTVTYSDGSTLTVVGTDAAQTYFSYQDAGGVIIDGNIGNTTDDASLYVDPLILSKANLQLQIVKLTNDSGVVSVGNNRYEIGVDCGKVIYTAAGINGTGGVASGALESSNVDLSEQFANMIMAQRLVQANSQVFNKANDVLETLVYLGQ